MNGLERLVYDVVKTNPWLKNFVRNVYQKIFDLMPKRKNFFTGKISIQEGYFFGFHDISPFSSDEKKVLANKPRIFLTMPPAEEPLEVGYFNFSDGELVDYVSCEVSKAWNHHKGCRLQWLGENEIIFNNSRNGSLCSTIYNLETKKSKDISFPIDTVHKESRLATSFSYERLENLMPGYGYPYADESYLQENHSSNTGMLLIDLEGNKSRVLVSLDTLVKQMGNSTLEQYRHYVTHSEFSANGRYISFLHRWVGDDVMKRWSRLVIFDLHTNLFSVLPTSGMVSHYVWNEDNQIVAYCSVDGQDGHVLFDIDNGGVFKRIASNKLNSDGHQSFVSNDEFITDTYPDKYRTAKIYRVNVKTESPILLASVYSPKKYQSKLPFKHIACDLHPRVSKSGEYVCFDTVYPGKRSLAVMKIK